MPIRLRFRTALGASVALGLIALLPGCVAVVAAGAGGAAGGYAVSQERSVGDQINDVTIRSNITQAWAKYSDPMTHALDATVYEGRVLLTGRVPNPEWRDQAVKLAWQVNGVKDVYNEIEIGPITSTGEDLSDTQITGRLRSDLLFDGEIRSVNYTITTAGRVVYLIGSARTQAELDRVTNYARNIPDVRRVVSYVMIRPGAPAGQQQPAQSQPPTEPAPAAPPANQAPASPPPSRAGAIEVQPLQ